MEAGRPTTCLFILFRASVDCTMPICIGVIFTQSTDSNARLFWRYHHRHFTEFYQLPGHPLAQSSHIKLSTQNPKLQNTQNCPHNFNRLIASLSAARYKALTLVQYWVSSCNTLEQYSEAIPSFFNNKKKYSFILEKKSCLATAEGRTTH